MHGAGNDFVFVRDRAAALITPSVAKRMLDRHFGIGGDQLLVLDGSGRSGASLVIYNADGSTAEMCGNGVRAVAHFLKVNRIKTRDFTMNTKAGPIGVGLSGPSIEVDMGRPILEGRKIPVKMAGEVIAAPLSVDGRRYFIHAVSMGNPHCVIFVPNVDSFPVGRVGPRIERHPFFPNRVNVEFVQVLSRGVVRARVWERGAGETLACGTGACAITVAGARAGKTGRRLRVRLPGGTLRARWAENDRVYLSGPAEISFAGTFILP